MTWKHYALWLIASGGALLDGFSVVSLGIALPLLKRDFTISPLLVGLIGSSLVLSAVAGAALGGVAADRLGRERVFIADMTIIGIAGVIGAVAAGSMMRPTIRRPSRSGMLCAPLPPAKSSPRGILTGRKVTWSLACSAGSALPSAMTPM